MAQPIFKAQPTLRDVHVNRPLTDLSVAFIQSSNDFIAEKVFPTVNVAKQSDQYFVYPRDNWNRSQAEKRAPATESAGSGWELSTDSYRADKYAIHKDVADDIRANADAAINIDSEATQWVTQQCMLIKDITWAAEYFTTTVWDTDLTGVSGAPGAGEFQQWNESGSTPIEDISAQMIAVKEATGFMPNSLVLSSNVWNVLKNHAQFTDRIKFTQTGIVTNDLIAAVLDLERVMVGWAIQNTAVEGATEASEFILSTNAALLVYAAPSPGLLTPSGGYTFAWSGLLGAGAFGNRIKTFRMEHLEADRVECEVAFDTKLVAASLGVFFTTAVA